MKKIAPIILICFVITGDLMAYEEPAYQVVNRTETYEVRNYEPAVAAETEVESNFEDAGNVAFRRLADYIGGKNQSSAKINMTAPVTQAAASAASEKIPMTAPVTQSARDGKFVVRFILPSKYTVATAPIPQDPAVKITQIPARQFAVYTYSGSWSTSLYTDSLRKLQTALRADGLQTAGEAIWARYNSPFSLWFLRRNEIWLPLAN